MNVEPVLDPDEPPGTLRWRTWTGRDYLHRPPEAAVAPLHAAERIPPTTAASEEVPPARDIAGDASLTDEWTRSIAEVTKEDERRRQRQRGRMPTDANVGSDDPPPF